MKELYVKIITQYGTERIQPACVIAQTFTRIAGTKTLSRSHIADIKALGYKINVVAAVTI